MVLELDQRHVRSEKPNNPALCFPLLLLSLFSLSLPLSLFSGNWDSGIDATVRREYYLSR